MKSKFSEFTYAVNSLFIAGMALIVLYKNNILPAPALVVTGFWFVAIASPLVILITLLRWIKKFPTKLTWLQGAYGTTSVCTSVYTSISLYNFYEGSEWGGLGKALVWGVIILLSAFAFHLTKKALAGKFGA